LNQNGTSRLTGPANPMPDYVRRALEEVRLTDAFNGRPPYQRNDHLGWIGRAKRDETKRKRLAQMLSELEEGSRYMKMTWKPR
jgi:uncharacterized protein YdeI (YjbR/CyaY-like superfamily)